MKTSLWGALALAVLAAAPAAAQDAAAGERVFSQCMACHQITDAAGTVIRRGGAVGPNLYGVAGRAAAAAEGFRYGPGIVAAAEKGLVWDAETFVAYLADPNAFMQEFTGDSGARSNMPFRLPNATDAANVYAYLESVAGN